MCVKHNTIIYVARASNSKRDCGAWSLLLLATTLRSFAHMPLGISDRNTMVLWPGCGGRDEFNLHTKNVRSVWFVVKRRGCCCNLSGGVALIAWFTTNRIRVKNNTIMYVARASNSKRDCGTWSRLLLATTVRSFAHMPLGFPIATLSPGTATTTVFGEISKYVWNFVRNRSVCKIVTIRQAVYELQCPCWGKAYKKLI